MATTPDRSLTMGAARIAGDVLAFMAGLLLAAPFFLVLGAPFVRGLL